MDFMNIMRGLPFPVQTALMTAMGASQQPKDYSMSPEVNKIHTDTREGLLSRPSRVKALPGQQPKVQPAAANPALAGVAPAVEDGTTPGVLSTIDQLNNPQGDNIDAGGGWNPALAPAMAADAPDNIDVGGGQNFALQGPQQGNGVLGFPDANAAFFGFARALAAAGSPDPVKTAIAFSANDREQQEAMRRNFEMSRRKFQQIGKTPFFSMQSPDGTFMVVDEGGRPIPNGALKDYLVAEQQREVELFKNKTDYKATADVNAANQKNVNKTEVEQAPEVANALTQAAGLRDVSKRLGETANDLVPATGKAVGVGNAVVPDSLKGVAMPTATAIRQDAEKYIQKSLRETLGSQYTEKEGLGVLARAYDPSLPVAENQARLNRVADELEFLAKNKVAATEWMRKKGSLEGFLESIQSKATAASTGISPTDYASKAPADWGAFDPNTFEYRMSNGVLQRRKK
jgi:hypothetical protein